VTRYASFLVAVRSPFGVYVRERRWEKRRVPLPSICDCIYRRSGLSLQLAGQ